MPLRTRFLIVSLCALLAACQPGLQTPSPIDYPSGIELATRQIEQNSFATAANLLDDLTRSHPALPDAWRLRAGLYDLDAHPAEAHATFSSALNAVPQTTPGFADLALQSALLCVQRPELACDPLQPLASLPEHGPRRTLTTAARDLQDGHDLKALRQLIDLLEQQPPKTVIADIYFLAAKVYRQMNEPIHFNNTLFHAVNFATSPILVQRIELLWKSKP